MVGSEPPQTEIRADEQCESCLARPAAVVVLRKAIQQMDSLGRVIAEIDPRVAVCLPCSVEINANRRPLPPPRVVARVNPDTGKMEPA